MAKSLDDVPTGGRMNVPIRQDVQDILGDLTGEEAKLLLKFAEFLYWRRLQQTDEGASSKRGEDLLERAARIARGQTDEGANSKQSIIRQTNGQRRSRYDFSDLAGKLQWQGDALQIQFDLRNETQF